MPGIRLGGPSGNASLELGEVVQQVVGHTPHCLVRGVGPWLLTLDRDRDRHAVPPRPCLCQLEHVVDHGGDDVRGVSFIDRRSMISHG